MLQSVSRSRRLESMIHELQQDSSKWMGTEGAQSVLGSLVSRSICSNAMNSKATVRDWLGDVHQTALQLVKFDGISHGLPDSLMADPRINTTIVLCFLDTPQSTSNWSFHGRQGHNYLIGWYLLPDRDDGIVSTFEVQSQRADMGWARAVSALPGHFLSQLTNATPQMLVGNLLDILKVLSAYDLRYINFPPPNDYLYFLRRSEQIPKPGS
jgi:hypothetical protein